MGTLVFQATLGGSVNLLGPNIATNINFTLPSADGTNGQALTTNGSGVLAFSTVVSAPAGSNTQVQFNNSGAFGASSSLTWNGSVLTSAGFSGPLNGTVGATTANTGNFTTLTTSSTVTLNGGTANGVTYLDGSKVLTSGSALTFNGTILSIGNSGLTGDRYVSMVNSTGNSTFGTYGGSGYGSLTSGDAYTYTGKNIVLMADDAAASIKFSAGGSAEKMRLDTSGNLLVGTTTAYGKLAVAGSIASFASATIGAVTANSGYVAYSAYNGSGAYISLQPTNSSGTQYEAARIDSAGNLGLGVTPSAWQSSGKALEVAQASLFSRSSITAVVATNAYYNTAGNWIYSVSSRQSSHYEQFQGQHAWYTAPAGTAGNTISFTQAMTLDASGNLLVGTTNTALGKIVAGTASANSTGLRLENGSSTANNYISIDFAVQNLAITAGYSAYIRGHNSAAANYTSYLTFGTNGNTATAPSERMRLTDNGDLLVGTTSGLDARVGIVSASGTASINCGDAQDATAYGIVQIVRPTNQPDNKFHLSFVRAGSKIAGMGFLDNSDTLAIQNTGTNAGNGVTLTDAATSWGTTSDERKKDIKGNIENALTKLSNWRTVYFSYKNDEDNKSRVGLIAQDVQETLPEAVSVETDEIGTLQLRYTEVIPVLVKAIQELKAELDAYKASHP